MRQSAKSITSTLRRPVLMILMVVVLALTVAGCRQSGKTVAAKGEKTRKTASAGINLGRAEAKDPDPKKLVETKRWGFVPANQVGVMLKKGLTRVDAAKLAKALGGKVVGEIEYINVYQIETKGSTRKDLLSLLDKAGKGKGVVSAFPNVPVEMSKTQGAVYNPFKNDAYQGGANGKPFDVVGTSNAWTVIKAAGAKTNPVTVGVADQPVYTGSSEISVKSGKKSPVPGAPKIATNRPVDKTNAGTTHGTQVTGVIGADPTNGGSSGIASPLGDKLTIKVRNIFDAGDAQKETKANPDDPTQMQSNGKAYTLKTLVHLQKLVESGATIINCSFNYKPPGPNIAPIAAAYKKFLEKMAKDHPEVLFVASAGNAFTTVNGTNDCWGFKAPNLITVGALEKDGTKSDFSNKAIGDGEVTLSAPGRDIVVGVDKDGKPILNSGTSFSSPMVAAAAALIRGLNPKLTAAQIKKILVDSAAPGVTGDNQTILIPEGMGAGVLRIDEAVLQTINDIRVKDGLKPLKMEDLLAMGEVDLSADGGPTDFTVVAALRSVGAGTYVTIEPGTAKVSGSKRKRLKAAGSVTWNVKLLDKKGTTVKVARSDTGAMATVEIKGAPDPAELNGQWKGSMTITDVILPPGTDPSKKPEGCDLDFSKIKGKTVPLNWTIQLGEDGKGTISSQGGTGPMAVSYSGGAMSGGGSQKGATMTMSGEFTRGQASGYAGAGTMNILYGEGIKILASWTVSK